MMVQKSGPELMSAILLLRYCHGLFPISVPIAHASPRLLSSLTLRFPYLVEILTTYDHALNYSDVALRTGMVLNSDTDAESDALL